MKVHCCQVALVLTAAQQPRIGEAWDVWRHLCVSKASHYEVVVAVVMAGTEPT